MTSSAVRSTTGYDVAAIRREFPVLQETVNGHPLVYLDSAASAQKPQAVIDAERGVYERYYSNIHRGVHRLSTLATEAYENARDTIGRFLGAASRREIDPRCAAPPRRSTWWRRATAAATSAPATRC